METSRTMRLCRKSINMYSMRPHAANRMKPNEKQTSICTNRDKQTQEGCAQELSDTSVYVAVISP